MSLYFGYEYEEAIKMVLFKRKATEDENMYRGEERKSACDSALGERNFIVAVAQTIR